MTRPRIALLGRFSEKAQGIRSRGVVISINLLDYIWAGGGEPVTLLPMDTPEGLDWSERLKGIDGVCMPGGADLDPALYGEQSDDSVYGVNGTQDTADISLINYCIDNGIPLLTICRGTQALNIARGGSLVVDMDDRHSMHPHTVDLVGASELGVGTAPIAVHCNHHQALSRLGDGLQVLANSVDGIVEAVSLEAKAWTIGLQWHPEDTFREDPRQTELLAPFIAAAAARTKQ